MKGDGIYSPCGANGLGEEQGHSSSCHKNKQNLVQMEQQGDEGAPEGLLPSSN